jgi:hypothetical protein
MPDWTALPAGFTGDESLLPMLHWGLFMTEQSPQRVKAQGVVLYCPQCSREVLDPLTCGDCSAVICRQCGTPLESPDELGIG